MVRLYLLLTFNMCTVSQMQAPGMRWVQKARNTISNVLVYIARNDETAATLLLYSVEQLRTRINWKIQRRTMHVFSRSAPHVYLSVQLKWMKSARSLKQLNWIEPIHSHCLWNRPHIVWCTESSDNAFGFVSIFPFRVAITFLYSSSSKFKTYFTFLNEHEKERKKEQREKTREFAIQ